MLRRMVSALTVLIGMVALAGSAFGQNFDALAEGERQAMAESLQYALEYNPADQPAEWVNPDTDRAGAVVPIRTFENAQGQPCREFITTVIIGGREEQAFGTACRQADGDWKIVSGQQAAPVRVYTQSAPAWYDYPRYSPERYYYDPYGYYAPYNIFFSFSYVHRGGHYVDGRSFRHLHPVHVRERVHVGRFDDHYLWQERSRQHDRRDDRGRVNDRGRSGGGRERGGRR